MWTLPKRLHLPARGTTASVSSLLGNGAQGGVVRGVQQETDRETGGNSKDLSQML